MLQALTGSPTFSTGTHDDESIRARCANIPRNASTPRLSATPYHEVNAEAPASLMGGKHCMVADNTMGGATGATFGTFFCCPSTRIPHMPGHGLGGSE